MNSILYFLYFCFNIFENHYWIIGLSSTHIYIELCGISVTYIHTILSIEYIYGSSRTISSEYNPTNRLLANK